MRCWKVEMNLCMFDMKILSHHVILEFVLIFYLWCAFSRQPNVKKKFYLYLFIDKEKSVLYTGIDTSTGCSYVHVSNL